MRTRASSAIAEGQTFGVIYGSDWIRTPEQLATNITNGKLTGAASDYRLNELGLLRRQLGVRHDATSVRSSTSMPTGTDAAGDRRREPGLHDGLQRTRCSTRVSR